MTLTILFRTAETAAALMDSIHGETCPQSEGSDSAYEELYEVAQLTNGGFPGVWDWMATLAIAAYPEMEELWQSEELQYIDTVHAAAQELHNFVTDPANRPVGGEPILTPERAKNIWVAAAERVRQHDEEVRRHRRE